MAREQILAAGGIVLRDGYPPRIAIVQRRKYHDWVLPKGKLRRKENAREAAAREAVEETGHEVSVHEFLGSLSYKASGKPKVARFWRMQSKGGPAHELARDIKSVRWLQLEAAVAKLSRPREQTFLRNVAPLVLEAAKRAHHVPIAARLWSWMTGSKPRRRP